jgi:hypothetical protein
MPVARKASSTTNVLLKKDSTSKSVTSVRPVTVFEDLNDVNISSPQDGQVLIYDASVDNFVLVDPDVVLSQSVEDSDLPDDFITQLESELSLGNISVETLDGGGFI